MDFPFAFGFPIAPAAPAAIKPDGQHVCPHCQAAHPYLTPIRAREVPAGRVDWTDRCPGCGRRWAARVHLLVAEVPA